MTAGCCARRPTQSHHSQSRVELNTTLGINAHLVPCNLFVRQSLGSVVSLYMKVIYKGLPIGPRPVSPSFISASAPITLIFFHSAFSDASSSHPPESFQTLPNERDGAEAAGRLPLLMSTLPCVALHPRTWLCVCVCSSSSQRYSETLREEEELHM